MKIPDQIETRKKYYIEEKYYICLGFAEKVRPEEHSEEFGDFEVLQGSSKDHPTLVEGLIL